MNRIYAAILVICQATLAAAIVLSARWIPPDPILLGSIPGAALAIWAWSTMGLRRIRVGPDPDPDVGLVDHGPYGWIRHPMYVGVILFTAAMVPSQFAYWKLAVWISLVCVLDAKARYEERLLSQRIQAYEEYSVRTARFLPFLY